MSKHNVQDVEFVKCPYCQDGPKNRFKMLHWKHLRSLHNKTIEDVRSEFPNIPTMTLADFERKKNTAKMGARASKETHSDLKSIYCIYSNDDDCPGEEHMVPKNHPNVWVCETCRSLGKQEVDGRRLEHANKTREKTFSEKYGDGIINPQQVPEINRRTVETQRKKYGGVGFESPGLAKKTRSKIKEMHGEDNIMKTDEGIESFVKSMQKKYGKEITNPLHILEVARKVSESKIGVPSKLKGRTYEDIHGIERAKELKEEKRISGAKGYLMAPFVSKPQQELFDLTCEIFPFAKLDHEFNSYILDIAIIEHKLCIEYDGSFWHNKEHDKIRDSFLEKFGWKTIRFVDYVPTKEELINKIKEVLK